MFKVTVKKKNDQSSIQSFGGFLTEICLIFFICMYDNNIITGAGYVIFSLYIVFQSYSRCSIMCCVESVRLL